VLATHAGLVSLCVAAYDLLCEFVTRPLQQRWDPCNREAFQASNVKGSPAGAYLIAFGTYYTQSEMRARAAWPDNDCIHRNISTHTNNKHTNNTHKLNQKKSFEHAHMRTYTNTHMRLVSRP